MTGAKRTGKHRQPAPADEALQRAEAALEAAKDEKVAAVARQTFIDRLIERWAKVHQTNHLASLFTTEYRRTH